VVSENKSEIIGYYYRNDLTNLAAWSSAAQAPGQSGPGAIRL